MLHVFACITLDPFLGLTFALLLAGARAHTPQAPRQDSRGSDDGSDNSGEGASPTGEQGVCVEGEGG